MSPRKIWIKKYEAVMEPLQHFHREGATICVVTHDLRYASVADRTIQTLDGQIVNETCGSRLHNEPCFAGSSF